MKERLILESGLILLVPIVIAVGILFLIFQQTDKQKNKEEEFLRKLKEKERKLEEKEEKLKKIEKQLGQV